MLETSPFDAAEYLEGWDGVREYLIATLEDGEPWEVAKAFRTITRSPGFREFSEHIGRDPDDLARAISDPQRMDGAVMIEVINAIGWRIAPQPEEQAEAA